MPSRDRSTLLFAKLFLPLGLPSSVESVKSVVFFFCWRSPLTDHFPFSFSIISRSPSAANT
jgi:hypothetical protein